MKIMVKNENGVIFRIDKIPENMFNFYILKKRTFRDGTASYNLCVELNNNAYNKYIVLDTIRGTLEDALKRFEELLKGYDLTEEEKIS